jgi:hypothetical protein
VVIPNDYCLRLHQERIDQQLPKHGDPSWRQGELLALSDTKPAVLVDRNGVVAAWIFPHFLQEQSLVSSNTLFISLNRMLICSCFTVSELSQ